MSSQPTALVTGAGGFLGSHTVERLLVEGFRVRALDRDEKKTLGNLGAAANDPALTLEITDLLATAPEDSLFSGVDYLFHCAGIVDHAPSMKEPELYMEANVIALVRALEAARVQSMKRVINPSSAAVYGTAEWPTREDHPKNPVSPYGLTKWMAELAAQHWSRVFDVPTVSFRIFNGYGPRAYRNGVVSVFLDKCLAGETVTLSGDGNQKRDFIYISDIIDAFVNGAHHAEDGAVYNLGSGQPRTLNDLVKAMGLSVEYGPSNPGEPEVICADISKIKADLGWSAKVSLEEGIAKTLETAQAASSGDQGIP
jgi:UDP-glucose 4-epimerase